ncbi:hypothetical protein K466DRAFT_592873 [Polyporus arcularius HHB13444]|uniref:Uncharacterized protein n=1 Tax=Polyporus arcularius HHB13444 TaxID=1314778 RepID=A0A5C3NNH9_9APHY|nr:hypothetical protein K466DRAFT_592873 [Polyporus arcularius HHB13444]
MMYVLFTARMRPSNNLRRPSMLEGRALGFPTSASLPTDLHASCPLTTDLSLTPRHASAAKSGIYHILLRRNHQTVVPADPVNLYL